MVKVLITLKEHWPKLLATFLIGGATLAAVEFIAKYVKDPALAAVAGGLPVGLLSMYLISSSQSQQYARDYLFVTAILLTSILIFFIIRTNMTTWGEKEKYTVVSLVVFIYIILIYFRTKYASKDKIGS